jgi:hypothetical protein
VLDATERVANCGECTETNPHPMCVEVPGVLLGRVTYPLLLHRGGSKEGVLSGRLRMWKQHCFGISLSSPGHEMHVLMMTH